MSNDRLAGALICGLASAFACSDPEVIVEEGEHIDLHYAADFMLCGGTTEHFNRGVEFVAEQLGLDTADFGPMTYTWLGEEEYLAASGVFIDDEPAWAFNDESYSQVPDAFHEVVHLISHQEQINAITFLTEGLATAFQDKGSMRHIRSSHVFDHVDPGPLLGARYGKIHYGIAGSFVSYLLSRFGPEPFWELNRDLRFLSTGGKFRRRFARVYGLDLDEVIADYLADDTCDDERPRIPMPPSCAGPEVPWLSDDLWGYARVIDCADDDVIGGLSDSDDKAAVAITLRVEEAGIYDFRVLSDQQVRGVLRRCGGCPWSEPTLNGGREESRIPLERGIYSLMLHSYASDAPPVVATLKRLPDSTLPSFPF